MVAQLLFSLDVDASGHIVKLIQRRNIDQSEMMKWMIKMIVRENEIFYYNLPLAKHGVFRFVRPRPDFVPLVYLFVGQHDTTSVYVIGGDDEMRRDMAINGRDIPNVFIKYV